MLRKHLELKFKPALRGMPSYDFVLALNDVDATPPLTIDDTFVFALDAIDPHSREAQELYALVRGPKETPWVREVQVAIDLPTGLANVWCPQEGSFPLFGDLDLALAQMRAGVAAAQGAHGQKVNVVIIDQGINKNVLAQRVPGAKFLGGWSTPEFGKGGPSGPFKLIPPGGWRDDGLGPMVTHGTKMASLVLAVAPEARILDLALLPSHIVNLKDVGLVKGFLSWAVGAYLMLVTIFRGSRITSPAFAGHGSSTIPGPCTTSRRIPLRVTP